MRGRAGRRFPSAMVALFCSLWFLYGVLIESKNLEHFGLQHSAIEAIVERRHFYLEGPSAPQLGPRGDVFVYEGHKFAAKQPGQFFAGSVPYLALHAVGLSYRGNFHLVAALVTFLSASLAAAAAATVVTYVAVRLLPESRSTPWALMVGAVAGLSTTTMAYAGIAHHDILAMSYLVLAFGCAFALHRSGSPWRRRLLAGGTGLLLAQVVSTSGTPFFAAIVVALYTLSARRWEVVGGLLLGGGLGLVPLLVYNQANFGNALLPAYIAGKYNDTYFALSWGNFSRKAALYWMLVRQYAPITVAGTLGLALLPSRVRREQITIVGVLVALLGFLLNIGSDGDCQYGPRYLLAGMPFATLGLCGYAYVAPPRLRRLAVILLGVLAVWSAFANVVGAVGGAMYCQPDVYAVPRYLNRFIEGKVPTFPLAAWLLLPGGLSLLALVRAVFVPRHQRQLSRTDD